MANIKTKKRKFNAVDALILIIILAVIGAAAAIVVVRGINGENAENVSIEYVVEFRQIREEFADNFDIGTLVTDSVAKYQIGKIRAIGTTSALYSGNDLTKGEATVSEYPGHINVQMTVASDAVIGENGMYMIDGGYRISVGTAVNVRTPNYTGSGYCIEIKEVKK